MVEQVADSLQFWQDPFFAGDEVVFAKDDGGTGVGPVHQAGLFGILIEASD